jgi:phosphoribosyl 1,2-cyclic phosphodiesterase
MAISCMGHNGGSEVAVVDVGFYGVRGSCPCSDPGLSRYGGATASVSLDAGDGAPPLLLDLGTGCRQLGHDLLARYFPGEPGRPGPSPHDGHGTADEANARREAPRLHLRAFVTHLHFDHVQGLPFFGPALRPDVRLDVYGPLQDTSLEAAFAALVQPPYFPVGVGELPAEVGFFGLADRSVVEIGATTVLAREVPHVGSTLGFRVEAAGVIIAYLPDHQAPSGDGCALPTVSAAALELCRDADLLIHDAQYTDEEFSAKVRWGHSTVAYAVEVARQAGARRLALFHHDPLHDDDELDRISYEAVVLAGAAGLEVMTASQGTTVSVVPAHPFAP